MSGTLPTSPAPESITVESQRTVLVSQSQSGRQFARKTGTQLWSIAVKYPPMTRAEFAPIQAFIESQEGPFGTFDVLPPDVATRMGVGGGVPVVDGASQVGNTLSIRGGSVSTANWIMAGDYIRVTGGGAVKVYMITATTATDAFGKAVLPLNTALVASPPDGTAIGTASVSIGVRLDGPVQSWRVNAPNLYRFEFSATEAI